MSKKKKIDIVEELEKILMEELKKIGATQDFSVEITDSPAFKGGSIIKKLCGRKNILLVRRNYE